MVRAALERAKIQAPEEFVFGATDRLAAIFWGNYIATGTEEARRALVGLNPSQDQQAMQQWLSTYADFARDPAARSHGEIVVNDLERELPEALKLDFEEAAS